MRKGLRHPPHPPFPSLFLQILSGWLIVSAIWPSIFKCPTKEKGFEGLCVLVCAGPNCFTGLE
ncbi:unnamed protein product [Meloidogyne enterolobii]|uniref:Uncharacterized protein n=1 Tax=Meloidogyne enterolobii TaxID=390850 RepID=A0ACB1AGZ6_MELEN